MHQSALLVLEDSDFANPNEIFGHSSGVCGRALVQQDTASLVDRLEACQDGRIVVLRPEQIA